jgi:hypothetical protein
MAILDLQRRLRQLGEIRLGHVVDVPGRTNKRGEQMTRPEKLDKFRVTSPSRPLLERVAELYGGQVQPWTPANSGLAEFEVYTQANRVPVIVPPQAVTQWYELYEGSRCVRRCDSQIEQKSDRPCLCDPEKRDCEPTTRLNVMLRDVEALGVWLLTTRGYYAAVELPAYAELLARSGGYVEGWLSVEERRVVRADGQIARFMVPVLEASVSPAQLLASDQTPAAAAIAPPERKAIEAPTGPTDYLTEAKACVTVDAVRAVWEKARAAGHLTEPLKEDLKAVVAALTEQGRPDKAAAPVEDVDGLWQQVVAAWPKTMSELEAHYLQWSQGVLPESATADDLRRFLEHLKSQPTPEPAEKAKSEVPF